MQAYSASFARVYDLRWGGFARYVGPRIVEFLNTLDVGRKPARIVDLCCGAGHLSRILLEAGFSVTGIDLSPGMIEYARRRNEIYIDASLAEFVVDDARSFRLSDQVSIVISTFDAVNHFADIEELEACFRSVHDSLSLGGYFIFDINTRKGLESWNGLEVDDSQELTIISRGVFGEGMDRAYTHVSGFIREAEGSYSRFQETVFNTVFSVQDVRTRLRAVGFDEIRATHDAHFHRDLQQPEESDRVFFVCRRLS